MKDNKKISLVILIILLVIVDVILFSVLKTFTVARVINIIFIHIAAIVLWLAVFVNLKDENNKYLNYTKIPIVLRYSCITAIASLILIIINPKGILLTAIVQVIITGGFLIVLLTNKMADNKTEENNAQTQNKVDSVKQISDKLKNILSDLKIDGNMELYKKVETVYDKARTAKINVKSDATEIDSQILSEISNLENNIKANKTEEIDESIKNINKELVRRNSL